MIKSFTSLRFFFALLVLSSHFFSGVHRFFYEGFVGVTFFYVLSGFVLSYSYKERILSGVISKKDFYIARMARVFPLHLLTFLIAIPLVFYFSFNFFAKAGLNLFLLQSFIPYQPIYFSMNAVSWSISDEMFFYLLFPFLLPLLSTILSKRKAALFFLLGLAVAVVFLLNFVLPEQYKHPFLYISPIIRLVDFTIGILLYEIWLVLKGKTFSLLKGSLLEVGALLFFLVCLYFSKYLPISFRYSIYYWPAIVLLLLVFSIQAGFLSRILSAKLFVVLGESSFSLYMIHQLAQRYFDRIFRDKNIGYGGVFATHSPVYHFGVPIIPVF